MSDSSHDAPLPWVERMTPAAWTGVDAAVAALLAAATLAHLYAFPSSIPRAALIPLDLAATIPVATRRRYPAASLVVVTLALAIATAVGRSLAPAPVIALPLYSLTVAADRRRSLYALVAVEAALLAGLLGAVLIHRAEGDVTFNLVLAAASWVVGDAVRTRRGYLVEQERERRRRSVDDATRAVVEERLAIARELHDVLAHSLAVIAIQSGVGRHVIDSQPDQAREALETVEHTSRSALDELRHVLGALRSDDVARMPTPGVADLDDLAARVTATGIPVELSVDGDLASLAPGLQLSLYRIAQEALTNVVKHAPGARARVHLRVDPEQVRLEVTNSPGGPARPPGTPGHGLMGMRERASLFGGTLTAEPRERGGFAVVALFPHRRPQ